MIHRTKTFAIPGTASNDIIREQWLSCGMLNEQVAITAAEVWSVPASTVDRCAVAVVVKTVHGSANVKSICRSAPHPGISAYSIGPCGVGLPAREYEQAALKEHHSSLRHNFLIRYSRNFGVLQEQDGAEVIR